jgi:hypothetical protein
LLATGLGSPNPSLADAEIVHTGPDTSAIDGIVGAVACIEQAAADFGFGAEVVLHAPAKAAALLAYSRLNLDGLSPMGHRWILSPGYPAETGGDETILSIWATGTVWAAVSEQYSLLDPSTGQRPVDWRINLDAAFAQRLGLAAFDPCLNLTANFVVPACNGES